MDIFKCESIDAGIGINRFWEWKLLVIINMIALFDSAAINM